MHQTLTVRRLAVKTTKRPANSKTKPKAPAKKAAAKKVAVKKPVAKKAPVKKSAAAKPAAKKTALKKAAVTKPAVKKTPVKKPVAKKSAPVKKPVAKKPVAKKAVPAKKPALKKPVPAKKVTPSKKAVATRQTASQKSASTKAHPKVSKPTVAKKPLPAQSASTSVTTATKTAKAAKTVAPKTPAAKPTTPTMTPPAAEVTKKSPRAAKAMAMMPPPPGQSVASTTAKSSYGPITVPSLPAVVPMIPVKDPKLANNWKTKTAETVTEAEIMAMSDDDYMNAFQLGFFRHKLVQLKNDILVNAGETTEHLREDTVIVPDPADRATIEEEHALELRTRDRERKLLKKIEQSISRIDSGDYGYCDETGEPIGVGRLMARPTATLSLEAQQRRELKQKMFGD